jgi:hypothetical protein
MLRSKGARSDESSISVVQCVDREIKVKSKRPVLRMTLDDRSREMSRLLRSTQGC